jgi:hypothetical protein
LSLDRRGTISAVTDGLVLLVAWLEFLALLGVLAFVLLRHGAGR